MNVNATACYAHVLRHHLKDGNLTGSNIHATAAVDHVCWPCLELHIALCWYNPSEAAASTHGESRKSIYVAKSHRRDLHVKFIY